MARREPPTFNDGLLTVYRTIDVSDSGDMPENELIELGRLRYEVRTLGLQRFQAASQENVELVATVRVLDHFDISSQSIIKLRDGRYYRVYQVQKVLVENTPCANLWLSRWEADHDEGTFQGAVN